MIPTFLIAATALFVAVCFGAMLEQTGLNAAALHHRASREAVWQPRRSIWPGG